MNIYKSISNRLKSAACYKTLAAVIFFIICAQKTIAQQAARFLPQPGSYHMMLGQIEIVAFSDGSIPQELDKLLTNVEPEEVRRLTKQNFQQPTVEASVNAYLVKTGGKSILIDAGTSELYGPSLGHLPANMRAAGYNPEQIDAILITHIHTDHTGGLIQGDKIVFPNATVYVSKAEADYWLNEDSFSKAPAKMKPYFEQARMKMLPYVKAGRVKTFVYGTELFPGIMPVASPGHTPGHSFYQLTSQGQKIMFWGDILHSGAVQFARPEVTIVYDVDPGRAASSRKKAFREAAANGYWIAGDHLSFPGIGHVKAYGNAYQWYPINYTTTGSGQ
ncbi:MBL fold metallo-hydrolase [Pedobacter mucosus]|uniref:MBL fold metallo-hydrolase n=1 Tax=Pedobacter mucosus TaxID=2895286 RepID=UPI001EE3F470|nr:MBL fold metallo-hydrolase [Pedobacter mucosus]UKT65025.1 MBL fold metallo-hydrolase [Pedobacter mucosus]